MPLISVVIPTHNRKEKLKRLLASVLKSNYRNIEIIVVDDASTDGTIELKEAFPVVHLVRNSKERLSSGSRNVGILNSSGDLIFLIDDDNVIAEDTLDELANVMYSDMSLGVAGPVMYYLYAPSRVWCGRVKRGYITSFTVFPERDMLNSKLYRILESEDFPNAFMIRRSVVDKVGLFDEVNFPIHYDEADFCKRVRQAGFRIVLVPTARVWHEIPLAKKVKDKARFFHIHNEFRAYYAGRNRIIFHKKYSARWQFLIFVLIFNWLLTLYYLKIILFDSEASIYQRVKISRSYLRGVLRGIRG